MRRTSYPFTLFFMLLAILGILLNIVGIDDIGLFIGLDPILSLLNSTRILRDSISAIPYLWHVLHMITMIGYGLLLDSFRRILRISK